MANYILAALIGVLLGLAIAYFTNIIDVVKHRDQISSIGQIAGGLENLLK